MQEHREHRDDAAAWTAGLTKRYGARTAVEAVTWTVPRGSTYGLVGPNGAGKTTLLRAVAGLVRPTSGRVVVAGRDVVRGSPPPALGALIEGPGFVPHLSGRANLRHLARLRGVDDRAVATALDRVSLQRRAGDRYRGYSLGMKQRLGVAAALLGDPPLLLLDEPTNGLDPGGVADMHRLLADLAAQGTTVVVSSHALADVEHVCPDVAVVVGGRLVADAPVATLVGPARTRVRATDLAAARRALADGVRPLGCRTGRDQDGEHLDLDAGPDDVPGLVRRLVAAGVDVREVTAVRRSLAEVYADLLAAEPARGPGA